MKTISEVWTQLKPTRRQVSTTLELELPGSSKARLQTRLKPRAPFRDDVKESYRVYKTAGGLEHPSTLKTYIWGTELSCSAARLANPSSQAIVIKTSSSGYHGVCPRWVSLGVSLAARFRASACCSSLSLGCCLPGSTIPLLLLLTFLGLCKSQQS